MSIETTSLVKETRAAGITASAPMIWAGRSTVAIGLLHIAFFAVRTRSQWPGWIGGDLHGPAALENAANLESLRDFWALPGSFAVPLILLGLLISRMGRSGQTVPAYLPWVLLSWVALCAWILEPSGFPLGLIPIALLFLARRGQRHQPR